MKKIFIFVLSFFCCFSVYSEVTNDDIYEVLQQILQTQVWSGDNEYATIDVTTSIENLVDYLCYQGETLQGEYLGPILNDHFPYLTSNLDILVDRSDFISSIFSFLSDNWQDIYDGFSHNHADLVNVRNAIHDLEMTQEGYLSGSNGYLEQIGYGLSDIIDILNNRNGSSLDLPQMGIEYYPLTTFGKDVDIKNLSLSTFETSGEYNKDVHRLLISLNQIGSSQNNAALSILTNVQFIATLLSEDAEGKEKVEKDLEDREYQSTKAESELSNITSENLDGYFSPPQFFSDVYANLSISVSDPGLPDKITVMDRFYYDTTFYNFEFDEISFDIPQGLIDLANYARIVFGFVYWSLTLLLAIFIFRLWMKIYSFVTQNFVNS